MKRTRQQTATVILRIKAQVRQRDGYRCVGCGLTAADHIARHGRQLQVHRKVPGSLYTLAGSETLCCACHGTRPKRAAGVPDLANGDRARTGVPLHVYVPRDLREALVALAKENYRTLTAEVILALEGYLTAAGEWPPPAPPG